MTSLLNYNGSKVRRFRRTLLAAISLIGLCLGCCILPASKAATNKPMTLMYRGNSSEPILVQRGGGRSFGGTRRWPQNQGGAGAVTGKNQFNQRSTLPPRNLKPRASGSSYDPAMRRYTSSIGVTTSLRKSLPTVQLGSASSVRVKNLPLASLTSAPKTVRRNLLSNTSGGGIPRPDVLKPIVAKTKLATNAKAQIEKLRERQKLRNQHVAWMKSLRARHPKLLGRGSTINPREGRFGPRTPEEGFALEEAMLNPAEAKILTTKLADPRWSLKDGWRKMEKEVVKSGKRIVVHYVYNESTDEMDDFKIVVED